MNMQSKGQRVFRVFVSTMYSLSIGAKKGLALHGATIQPDTQGQRGLMSRGKLKGEGFRGGEGVGGGNRLLVFRLWAKLFMQILNK